MISILFTIFYFIQLIEFTILLDNDFNLESLWIDLFNYLISSSVKHCGIMLLMRYNAAFLDFSN